MRNEYFNMIGYGVGDGKMILLAVVPEDVLGDVPVGVFQVQAVRTVPTVFTGSYPTIRVLDDTYIERPDLAGMGADGILTGANWYNVSKEDKDILGINL